MRAKKFDSLYVVMHDGCNGAIPSIDSGNPFCTLKGAREAIARMGPVKARVYYIVKFVAQKQIGRSKP